MYLAEQLKSPTDLRLRLSAQLGVAAIIGDARPNLALLGENGHWTSAKVAAERDRMLAFGLRLEALALNVGTVLVDSLYDRDRADAKVELLKADIRAAAAAGVTTLKYNLQMFGIARTGTVVGRGGVAASVFRAEDYRGREGSTYWQVATRNGLGSAIGASAAIVDAVEGPQGDGRSVDEAQAWDAIEYLLSEILPVAEAEDVRLAGHPQDPAFPPGGLDGVEHVVASIEGLRRFLALGGGCRAHGLNFCQGTIGAMSPNPNHFVLDCIREFGSAEQIFMVHFRNIAGGYLDFTETFPDEGVIDMPAAIRAYREVGYNGMLCPDHVPMSDLDEGRERFFAFSLGYTRGLLQSLD